MRPKLFVSKRHWHVIYSKGGKLFPSEQLFDTKPRSWLDARYSSRLHPNGHIVERPEALCEFRHATLSDLKNRGTSEEKQTQ